MRKYLLLGFILLLIHITYLPNGFIWLDHGDIEAGRAIVNPVDVKSMLTRPFAATNFYRPVVTFSHSLDFALFKLDPIGYHATNLLIFLAIPFISILFLSCFFELKSREKIFVILFIGLHPLGWLPLGAISYRPELLFVLFTVLAIITHVHFRKTNKMVWRYFTLVFIFLSLLSKETAIVIVPSIIFIWEIWNRNRLKEKLAILFYIEEFLVLIVYCLLRLFVVPNIWVQKETGMNLSQAVGTRIFAILQLLKMLVSPFLPRLSDSIRVVDLSNGGPVTVFVLIIITALYIRKTKNKQFLLMILLFAVSLLPALNMLPLPRFVSPHYAFFPMIIVGGMVILFFRHFRSKNIATIILISWLIVAALQTFFGGYRFKTDYALFYPEVKKDENFLEGHFYLGDYYFSTNKNTKAEKEYTEALKINSGIIAYVDRSAAILKLANVKRIKKKYSESEKLLEGIVTDPNPIIRHVAVYDLAVVSFEAGDYEKTHRILKENMQIIRSDRNAMKLLESADDKVR